MMVLLKMDLWSKDRQNVSGMPIVALGHFVSLILMEQSPNHLVVVLG